MVGKQVGDSGDLLALQTFNIAYDSGILPHEDCRVRLSAMYDILAFTGCRPAEIVDNERKRPEDGTWDELFADDHFGVSPEDSSETLSDSERQLENLLIREQLDRGRPKALCNEESI
ncbi:hypothetical protein QQS21_006131 [Conoideocrella luteorostrata]|uniref:Uncharacterized protein n=1 Tax=Conoideocrella luteorostrata TaxID=1105319 RepID=A0AAJ0FT77_9HYPO|nr:hypothetical protein QQS21_006131 [Conoideocrella luteorostrata]